MSTEAYQAQAILSLPPDVGSPLAAIEAAITGTFARKTDHRLALSGSGTHSVGFGSIAGVGAKAVLVSYPAQQGVTQAPIGLRFNGSNVDIEVSPGGCCLLSNPGPTAGVTSLVIAYASSAEVRVVLLG